MPFGINFTQLILVGGGAAVIYYMWLNKIPPFDKLEFPSLGVPASGSEDPIIEATDAPSVQPDVIPGKDGVVADFNNQTDIGMVPGGGTSGSLEDDFFVTLARQKALLGDDFLGGGSGSKPREVGDAPLYGSNNNNNNGIGLSASYNNITFDQYGNTVIVPIPQTATDIATCQNGCMISCGNMYNKDPRMKEACESGCSKVCSAHYSPPTSYQFPPYYPAYHGKKLGWRKHGKISSKNIQKAYKTYVSRHADKINSTMPPDETEILGVGHREKQMNVKSLIQAQMMLRPMHSSRNMLKLTCGQGEVCNV